MLAYSVHRIRKVKCDEGRPSCCRCVSTGRICDGYGIWGGERSINDHFPIGSETCNAPLHSIVLSGLAANREEKTCFEWFRCRSAKKVQGIFVSHFWDTLIFQVSTNEPAVLHAMLALCSVHRIEDIDSTIRNLHTKDMGPDREEAFALRQYVKAISYLYPHFSVKNKESVRVALIACVLFTCLEFFRGHYKTGQIHLLSGVKLLGDFQSYSNTAAKFSTIPNSFGESIDDWITEALFRLHVQVGLFNQGYQYPYMVHKSLGYEPSPTAFRTMLQARNRLDLLMDEVVHMTELGKQQGDPINEILRSDLFNRQKFVQAEPSSWLRTYTTSKATILAEMPVRNGFADRLLRMNYIMADIMAHACLWPTGEWIFDSHADDFVSLLSIGINLRMASRSASETLIGDYSGMSRSIADMGWIPPLYYTAIKCRIHRVRLHAIKLLESAPHKEGIWDAKLAACVVRKVMEMEECGFYTDMDEADEFYIGSVPNEEDLLLPALPNLNRIHDVRVTLPNDPLGNIVLLCRCKQEDSNWTVLEREYDVLSQCWITAKEEITRSTQ